MLKLDEKYIIKKYTEGASANKIAKELETTSVTIIKRLRKNGINIRPPSHYHLKPQLKQKILKLHKEGKSQRQIAEIIGVTRPAIQKHLNSMGIYNPTSKNLDKNYIINEYNKGTPITQIASQLNVTHDTIRRRIKKYGIKNPKEIFKEKNQNNIGLLIAKGKTCQFIANKYNKSPSQIKNFTQKYLTIIKPKDIASHNKQKIIKWNQQGIPRNQIAKKLGIHETHITNTLKKLNIPPSITKNTHPKHHYIIDPIQLTIKYTSGKNITQIAKEHNTSAYFISTQLKKLNIPIRPNTGENNPAWQGGVKYGKYCPKFNDNLKKRVRKYWNNKCQICGITNKKHQQLYKNHNLPIHHVNHDKQTCCNNNKPLLIPLCHSCHGKINHKKEWEEILTNYIMIHHNGKCYLPHTP